MAKQTIKGLTCQLVLDLPEYVDDRTKSILKEIFSYCLDEESKDKVLKSVEKLFKQTNRLVKVLKEANKHTKTLEDSIREFVGIQLNMGFSVGNYYTPGEDGPEISEAMEEKMEYSKTVFGLPATKRGIGELVFYCMDLSRLAFETGMMLSYYLSEELVEQHQKELKKSTFYIG